MAFFNYLITPTRVSLRGTKNEFLSFGLTISRDKIFSLKRNNRNNTLQTISRSKSIKT